MDTQLVEKTLKKVREKSKKRNFSQSVELIVNLKDINIKKPEDQIDLFISLHYSTGRKPTICAFIGPELAAEAKNYCDEVISVDDFGKYAENKKLAKALAKKYDFFIAQATVMPKVAATFGRVLGPRGKMPNPKAGCVVPPNANLKNLAEKLGKTIKVSAKAEPSVKCAVGTEKMEDAQLVDNIITVYNNLIHHLPGEKNNIKSAFLKMTMGPAIEVTKDSDDKGDQNE
ncbi:MAG: 50S ribosomal protein L1 [archaeon]